MAHTKSPSHRWPHDKIAKIITTWGKANPDARCVRCGNTLDKCGPRGDGRNRNGTPCTWDAGHRVQGDASGGYQLECSHCNRKHGAEARNARLKADQFTPW